MGAYMSNDFFKNYFFPCKRKTSPHRGVYKIKLKSYRCDQREGMGLQEYQAMTSLCDIARDGVLSTFRNRIAPDRDKWCGRVVGHVQNHAGSLSSSQPGEPPCWASPLVFGLIGSDHRVHTEWQWPLSGVHSILMVKSTQPAEDKGCTLHPPPFTLSTITSKVVVYYAPSERADTLPLFLLYPYMYSVVATLSICYQSS